MPAPRAREQPRVPGERQPLLPRGARGPRRWRRAAGAAVLLVEMLERAAFFGVTANLVLYLNSTNFNWTGEQATRAALVFLGASYLLAPVGGWLADVYLGRYRAVALSLLLYLAASGLLPATAFPDGRSSFCGEMPASPLGPACPSAGCPRSSPSPYCAPVLYAGLLLLGLAASSVRSNLTSFGADQVMDLGRDATRPSTWVLCCRCWWWLLFSRTSASCWATASLWAVWAWHFSSSSLPPPSSSPSPRRAAKCPLCLSSLSKTAAPSCGNDTRPETVNVPACWPTRGLPSQGLPRKRTSPTSRCW
uniref:Solute carrier family 15 member 3 n=1 Tax=Pan troglodytes TaxID=9598 RepID=A0A2I3SIL6_PANTR